MPHQSTPRLTLEHRSFTPTTGSMRQRLPHARRPHCLDLPFQPFPGGTKRRSLLHSHPPLPNEHRSLPNLHPHPHPHPFLFAPQIQKRTRPSSDNVSLYRSQTPSPICQVHRSSLLRRRRRRRHPKFRIRGAHARRRPVGLFHHR